MTTQFTTGPWDVYSTRSVRDSRGIEVAHTMFRRTQDERRANASLIAAAPELYEALDDLVSFLRAHIPHFKTYNPLTEDADKALAKARGVTA